MEKIEELKFNILEHRSRFFTDEELIMYLEKNRGNVRDASYECLIIKAENTGLEISGLTTKDTSKYFLRLASKYARSNSGVLK